MNKLPVIMLSILHTPRSRDKIPKRLFIKNEDCYNQLRRLSRVLNETVGVLEELTVTSSTSEAFMIGPFDKAKVSAHTGWRCSSVTR